MISTIDNIKLDSAFCMFIHSNCTNDIILIFKDPLRYPVICIPGKSSFNREMVFSITGCLLPTK